MFKATGQTIRVPTQPPVGMLARKDTDTFPPSDTVKQCLSSGSVSPKPVEWKSKVLQDTAENLCSVGTVDVSVPTAQCVTTKGKWFWMYHVRAVYEGHSYTILRRYSDF